MVTLFDEPTPARPARGQVTRARATLPAAAFTLVPVARLPASDSFRTLERSRYTREIRRLPVQLRGRFAPVPVFLRVECASL